MKTKRKTAEPDPKERLRRALSYREKAVRDAIAADGDQAKFAAASHAREAERLLLGIRDELSRNAAALGEQLRQTLASQKSLYAQAASGTIGARKANRLNRRLVARTESLRGRIEDLNRCLNATASEELGGFDDMPLAGYVRAIRKTPPRLPVKLSAAGFVLWVGLVALAVLGSLYYLDYFKAVPPVVMEVAENESGSAISVMCRNDSEEPILLYVPGHDLAGVQTAGFRGSKRYGIAVYIRERDSRQFRLFPVSVNAWTYQGRTLKEGGPIEVAPRLYVNLVLDQPHAFAGANPDAIRIVLLNYKGNALAQHQLELAR